MSVGAVILLSLLAVLLIAIIWVAATEPKWAHKDYLLAHLVENPETVYRRSTGLFDEPAQLALRRIEARENPTPEEYFLAGRIIAHNIFGPAVAEQPQHHRRARLFADAGRHFLNAVRGLGARPPNATRNETHILDVAWLFNQTETNPLEAAAYRVNLSNVVEARRREMIASRRAVAAAEGPPAAAANAYIRLATQETDDDQNTHDSGVLASLRAIVVRLREDAQGAPPLSLEGIADDIKKDGESLSEGRPYRVKDALDVIAQKISANTMVSGVGATDAECLQLVWRRADHPRNVLNRRKLREAVFTALCDCWEDGLTGRMIVCANGRVARVLGALVLLDFDEKNWVIKKLEQFKNDIFTRAGRVIEERARAAAASGSEGAARAGRAYLAQTPAELAAVGEPDPAAAEELAAEMRKAIGEMVDDYIREYAMNFGIADAIPKSMVEMTKQEAIAAVA